MVEVGFGEAEERVGQRERDEHACVQLSATGLQERPSRPRAVALIESHRRAQLSERLAAGSLWDEGGWLFATRLGRPINPNGDCREWKALLVRAGVRHARLHDARHTAATVLLVLGVPERTVMSIMGWSSTSMAARYQHVTQPSRREVANRVGGLLFGEAGAKALRAARDGSR